MNRLGRLSAATRNFWLQLLYLAILAIVLPGFVYFTVGPAFAGAGLALIIIGLFYFLDMVKEQVLQALPDEVEIVPALPEEFPNLDHTQLQYYTEELHALGFTHLMDCRAEGLDEFDRILVHPDHHCYVEVIQAFARGTGEILPMFLAIGCHLSGHWGLSVLNRPADAPYLSMSYMWQEPKDVRIFRGGYSAAALLDTFLDWRDRLCQDLEITPSTDISRDAYITTVKKNVIQRKRLIRRKPLILAVWQATRYELNPRSEWLGEYGKILQTKAN